MLSIESFVDGRDGERYGAQQFILSDGSLMTLMSENLRAKVYSDGEELPYPYNRRKQMMCCSILALGDIILGKRLYV